MHFYKMKQGQVQRFWIKRCVKELFSHSNTHTHTHHTTPPRPHTQILHGTLTFWPQPRLLTSPVLTSCHGTPDSHNRSSLRAFFVCVWNVTDTPKPAICPPHLSLPFPQPEEEVLLCVTIALGLYFWPQWFFSFPGVFCLLDFVHL